MNNLEALRLIIQEARELSPEFDEKYHYWIEKRRKAPTHDWLLKNLLSALGEARLLEHLKEQIKD